jgi:hypothetical protein
MMIVGDLVHIPQNAFLLRDVDRQMPEYIKTDKPVKALFWDRDPKHPRWGMVYYNGKVWSVRMKDIYPITQELENVS